ncbi:hypothetical protein [Paraburkholderia fungorum]|nr:hypothetical protein [Paraburkholderia fungorum]
MLVAKQINTSADKARNLVTYVSVALSSVGALIAFISLVFLK